MRKYARILLIVILLLVLVPFVLYVVNYESSNSNDKSSLETSNPPLDSSLWILDPKDLYPPASLIPDQKQETTVQTQPTEPTVGNDVMPIDDLTPSQDHETSIPEQEENVPDPFADIDVSSESIENLSASYFASPDDATLQKKLYAKLRHMYLSAEWDGFPLTVGDHVFSISRKGCINADASSIGDIAEPLDLPNQSRYYNGIGLIDDCNIQYIPGKGSYILVDDKYMLYLRGEKIPLEGGDTLDWKSFDGVDVNYGHASLFYVASIDKLFLVTPMNFDTDSSLKPYLFIFPDYNVAKIELVDNITFFSLDENDCKYQDENGDMWHYVEGDDGSYSFELSS